VLDHDFGNGIFLEVKQLWHRDLFRQKFVLKIFGAEHGEGISIKF
jgi:hypothetical protein